MLISTHNLGTVPEFCDRSVLIKGTILKYGLTENVLLENLENAFGGVLRHFSLGGTDYIKMGTKEKFQSCLTMNAHLFNMEIYL